MLAQAIKTEPLLKVNHLEKHYPVKKDLFGKENEVIKAVDGVSFTVYKGETFSIVGESGCGKTTTGMCLNRLIEPTSGEVLFEGENVVTYSHKQMKKIYRNMQIIFQDPYSSLNPKFTIQRIISEPLIINRYGSKTDIVDRVRLLLELVGLRPEYMNRYPHELSGGQKQRVGIARALALNPKLIICDEPVSALDVSIQAQIVNLLKDLQEQLGLTYIFISHDLSVVELVSDRIAVMYLGKIVEQGTRDEIFTNPQHPYTKVLLSSIPIADPKAKKNRERIILKGDMPSPKNPPKGCHFHTRCPFKTDICVESYPEHTSVTSTHRVACHHYKSLSS